jgi:hypothetical protein
VNKLWPELGADGSAGDKSMPESFGVRCTTLCALANEWNQGHVNRPSAQTIEMKIVRLKRFLPSRRTYIKHSSCEEANNL